MDKLNYKDIAAKSIKELITLRSNMRRKLMNLRFQKASGSSSINFSEFKKAKKIIAQVNTFINSNIINPKSKRGG